MLKYLYKIKIVLFMFIAQNDCISFAGLLQSEQLILIPNIT